MSTVSWLSAGEQGEWDAFVAKHPLGLVYHLSTWRTVLESAFGHIRGRFLVLRDAGGKIRAGLPVYGVKSWLLQNRLVSVPFATMCDPLVSTKEEFDLLWPALEDVFWSHKSRRIEIRARRARVDAMPDVLTPGVRYKHHYLPLAKSDEALFRSFHESCVRRRVMKAQRAGVLFEERNDEQSLRALHGMLVATRRRHALPPMPFAFFEAMYRWLGPGRISLYLALHQGKPVAGLLALKFKDLWVSEYSGNLEEAPPGTNQLLYWEVIRRANSSGAQCFSFGRTQPDNTSLLEYKRRWATVEEDLTDFVGVPAFMPARGAVPERVAPSRRYAKASRWLLRFVPATIQKSVGNFCYRHLG